MVFPVPSMACAADMSLLDSAILELDQTHLAKIFTIIDSSCSPTAALICGACEIFHEIPLAS